MESYRSHINLLFFDPRRYDLARFGRFKMNNKLCLFRRIAGYKTAEDIIAPLTGELLAAKGFLCGMGDILFQGGVDFGFRIAEVLADLLIGAKTQCAQEGSNRQLAVFINAHIIYIGRIGFVFQPCAADGGKLPQPHQPAVL